MDIKVVDQKITPHYSVYCGDSIPIIKGIPDNSIHYTIFSPPFAELYVYSDMENDLGNSKNYAEFFKHFEFLITDLYRVLMPGRCLSFHCIDIPAMKERDGYIGLKDFPGDLIRAFQKAGFIYHSKHIIWKDPLIEATRTKALGLMYKQTLKDSAICRAGLPDYLVTMRKPGENLKPINHKEGIGFGEYVGDESNKPVAKGLKYAHETWQKYASPIWMDVRQTFTLNRIEARSDEDDKHICPLQLDTIERALILWTSEDDIVLSPFAGIGSEGYIALKLNRRFIGIELNQNYYDVMLGNLENQLMIKNEGVLFDKAEFSIQ